MKQYLLNTYKDEDWFAVSFGSQEGFVNGVALDLYAADVKYFFFLFLNNEIIH